MNKAILIGRLASDPDLRTTGSGTAVCQFRLAVNRRNKNADGTRTADFIPVVAWRQQAELIHKFLHKGSQCGVVGQIQTRSYQAQDGSTRYVTEIIADEIEFVDSKADSGAVQAPTKSTAAEASKEGYVEIDDEELPF